MTAFDSGREGSMQALLAGPADWISPQNDGASGDYQDDPPAADGRKVILSDTDHLWGVGGDRVWVWKSFTRGHHPIYMDPLGKPDWVRSSEAEMEGARKAMGDTRGFADRMNLAAMTPQNDLASAGYCLAYPGHEYLVYQPKKNEAFSVELKPGVYLLEWFDPVKGMVADRERIETPGGRQRFRAPFAADAVLYLKRASQLSREVGLYHWVDFPIEAPGAADGIAKRDTEGSCIWTHENGATQRTSLLWYSGSGDTYVYRFGGSLQGRWTGRTRSPVAALDGLELTVEVIPSSNPKRIGWSGPRAGEPTAWAHQKGPDGELVKCTPILIMMLVFLFAAMAFAAGGQEGFEWQKAAPETQGMSSRKLDEATEVLSQKGTKTFLVIRNDKIVHEWYAPGFAPTEKHYTASMAKALVGGVSLMVALNDGRLNVDDSACKYIPEWKGHPEESKITIRQGFNPKHVKGDAGWNLFWHNTVYDSHGPHISIAVNRADNSEGPGPDCDYLDIRNNILVKAGHTHIWSKPDIVGDHLIIDCNLYFGPPGWPPSFYHIEWPRRPARDDDVGTGSSANAL